MRFLLLLALIVIPLGALVWGANTVPLKMAPPLSSAKATSKLAVTCLGPQTAATYGVFLHGIDTREESTYFREIKAEWEQLAKQLNMHVVLPRAPFACQSAVWQGKVCWNWNGSKEAVEQTWTDIKQAAAQCAPQARQGAAPAFVIGHSNGGYFINRLHELCLLPGKARLLSIGSAGGVGGARSALLSRKESAAVTAASCGRLDLMIGKGDSTYPKTVAYYEGRSRQEASVSLMPYEGGHAIPFAKFAALLIGQRP